MKILWIEDDPIWSAAIERMSIQRARARKKESIILVNSMGAAERQMRLETFDLVIVDLGLPDTVDGVASILRARSSGAQRFCVLSADPAARDVICAVERYLDGDFVGLFSKTPQLLARILHSPTQALEEWLPLAEIPVAAVPITSHAQRLPRGMLAAKHRVQRSPCVA
jgi:DNA-binding response OmpR family regulator